MPTPVPELPFDPAKPFHPLVICYLAQVHGFFELAARGLASHLSVHSKTRIAESIANERDDEIREVLDAASSSQVTRLIGQHAPYSRVLAKSIQIAVEDLANEIIFDHRSPVSHLNNISAGALLIVAWETTAAVHSPDPFWEFLRHCRNAAAHGGAFHFHKGEPKRPAVWRGISITNSLQGTPLFSPPATSSFIGAGDVLVLLYDIEHKFF